MEVGSSIEVRHQTAKSLAETSLYIETNAPQEKYYWSTIAPSPSISDCVFLHHILKMKPDFVYRTLDGRFIEVTTMGELSLDGKLTTAAQEVVA